MPKQIVHGEHIQPIAEGVPIVHARNLELKTPLGCPYSGVNLDIEQGEVFAICGAHGSGKSALLLTLAGRMLATKGELEVLGMRLPRHMGKVQKRVGLGFFEGLNDLHEAQPVYYAVAAEFELHGRKVTRDALDKYLQDWHLDSVANKRIGELTRQTMVRLDVALAWTGHPDIIVLNDIETGLTKGQSVEIMELLVRQTRMRNVTIVVGVLERDLAAMADAAVYLGEEPASNMPQEADTATRLAADEASGGANAPHGIGKDALQEFSEAASLQPVAREA